MATDTTSYSVVMLLIRWREGYPACKLPAAGAISISSRHNFPWLVLE